MSKAVRSKLQSLSPLITLIAEIIPEAYDARGRNVFRPDLRRRSGFKPTFPVARYLSQPLRRTYSTFEEMHEFLSTCRYISDQEQFGVRDYWQPPEEFEETKQGDCDDFALWTWRQLLYMGYQARFVTGRAGRYGSGHAWVSFQRDSKTFLFESLAWPIGLHLPRLSTVRYKPRFSVAWDGKNLSYFAHENRSFTPSFSEMIPLTAEWLRYWVPFWTKTLPKLPLLIANKLLKKAASSVSGSGS